MHDEQSQQALQTRAGRSFRLVKGTALDPSESVWVPGSSCDGSVDVMCRRARWSGGVLLGRCSEGRLTV